MLMRPNMGSPHGIFGCKIVHAVRQQILEILKESGSATVAELADGLAMVPISVRHHLDILQGDNLILVDRVRRRGSVGRPQQVYMLTQQAEEHFPENFAILAAGLVRQLKEHLPPQQVEASFCSLAKEMAGELPVAELARLSTPQRMDRVAAFLSQKGYLARWEKAEASAFDPSKVVLDPLSNGFSSMENGGGAYLLHTCNCPYAKVSSEHGELCLMDQVLVSELVGQSCRRIESLAKGGTSCTYLVFDNQPVQVS